MNEYIAEALVLLHVAAWFVIPWVVGMFVLPAIAGGILWIGFVRFLFGKDHARY